MTDIYEAVNKDNIDGFLKDFEAWLRHAVALKAIIPGESLKVARAGFKWNDDNENGVIKGVNIEIKEE